MKNFIFLFIFASGILSGCINDSGSNGPVPEGGYFEFITANTRTLNLDYGLEGFEHTIPFEVYADAPAADGTHSSAPLLRAHTDKMGVFSGALLLPIHVEKLYVCTDCIGVSKVIALEVPSSGPIGMVNVSTAPDSRATTNSGNNYPDDIKVLGDWNKHGVPQYLIHSTEIPNKWTLLNSIAQALPRNVNIASDSPLLAHRAVNITEEASVNMQFIDENSFAPCPVGYFTYPTGTPPASLAQVQKILAYPNASLEWSTGKLKSGYSVDLKYWDGTAFRDKFPAGTTIGFFFIYNGFIHSDNGSSYLNNYGDVVYRRGNNNNEILTSYYSIDSSNPSGEQHFCVFYNAATKLTLLGIEGGNIADPFRDFREMLFALKSFPADAIEPSTGIDIIPPDIPDPDEEVTHTTLSGTLIFEDLWPSHGDYDINDVVVEYESTFYVDIQNRVRRIVDIFRPVHNGAQIQSGFCFQYGVPVQAIRSMEVQVTGAPASSTPIPWQTDAKGFETDQRLATVKVFDDIRSQVVSGRILAEYRYETVFDPVDISEIGFPPYNPFVVIVREGEDPRLRELHLSGCLPSDKASGKWFGINDDRSVPAQRRYYISTNDYPFAINIPVTGFKLQDEGRNFADLYPEYHGWASSRGAVNTDWYLHPVR